MDPSTLPTAREQQRLAWARAAAGNPALDLERASVDAGFRSYWRTIGNVPSRIVMDSPPDKENVTGWLKIRSLLRSGEVRVPDVLAEDAEQGFMLLEDLGPHTYLHVIDADNADAMFESAFAQLLRLQRIPVPEGFPAYTDEVLLRELRLFDEWFLGVHLGVTLDEAESGRLFAVYRTLVDSALAQPQVLVHRDFMPRNLMPCDGETAVIDFQDALHGPIAYDATCLFKDAFLSWPEDRVLEWQARYHALATEAGLPVPAWESFRRDADLIGVHRHLKVIGIFARLNHRDGKPRYIADAPRFLAYLDAVLPRYPELQPLAGLLDTHVRPVLQGASAAA
jgi:N-acetylmuramate 1-kinase